MPSKLAAALVGVQGTCVTLCLLGLPLWPVQVPHVRARDRLNRCWGPCLMLSIFSKIF